MRRYMPLIRNDLKQIMKDPMLMASLFGPMAVIFIARFVFPLLAIPLEQRLNFSLYSYSDFIAAFLMLTIPLLSGAMAGLLMLDERDENIISYYAATPLTRHGYIFYRLTLPCLISTLLILAFLLSSGITTIKIDHLYALILLIIEAPCIALFLAAFASNKVEGLALAKICGLLFVGPVAAALVPYPWQYLALWLPSYWPAKSFLLSTSNEHFHSFIVFGVGLCFHLVLLHVLSRVFSRRLD